MDLVESLHQFWFFSFECQIKHRISRASSEVMAPRTRRSTARRKLNPGLQDETEIYENQNNQQATGGQVGNQIEEYELHESVQKSQLTSQVAPKEKVMAPRTQRSTARRKLNTGLQDGEIEIYEHQINQQATAGQDMTSRTQRSILHRRLNHRLQDEEEIEEYEQQKTSDKNKDHRKCSTMQQTTGKISFAEVGEELKEQLGRSPSRVEMFEACYTDPSGNPSCDEIGAALGEMKEVQSKLPTNYQDSVGPNDTFSKVMGKDPRGRVRMVGLGVNPLDISGGVPSRSECYRMVLENQVTLARMEEKVNAATNMIASLQKKLQQNASSISTARRPASPSQSSNSINLEYPFKVGDSVLLKSLFNSGKIVTKGSVRSIDPEQDVGGKRLGLNWCEVQISIPIEWDGDLIRPYSNLSTIGDAIGTCIAWPRHLVKVAAQD